MARGGAGSRLTAPPQPWQQYAASGVRVNAIVCAQLMNEELERRIAADPGLGETYLRGIPMGRIGDSNDIKGAAIFLASDASSYVTGREHVVDGGLTIW